MVSSLDEFKKGLADGTIILGIAYQGHKVKESITLNDSLNYVAYNHGNEYVINGFTDNSKYDAIPTISQTYTTIENPAEAANKAYVNNGLANKLDVTGGTIKGNLIVEGKTDTALGAIVSKNGDTIYGLAYDPTDNAFKLGLGAVGSGTDFIFNDNEGLPIALRDDSDTFTDGSLVVWSSNGNKFVNSGMNQDTYASKEYVHDYIAKIAAKSYYLQEIEDAYISRISGGGLNIINNQRTTLKEIQGETVSYNGELKNSYFQSIKSCGKNLLARPYVYDNGRDTNGVKFKVNPDGSITATGTANNSTINLCNSTGDT